MKRRNFIKAASLLATGAVASNATAAINGTNEQQSGGKQMYEWQVYSLIKGAAPLDKFFKEVLIPFYNKHNVKVGCFGSYGMDTPPKQYYLIVYPDANSYSQVKKQMWKDEAFKKAAQPYFDETAKNPIYTNVETSLCVAFDVLPQLLVPATERTILEFRTYWSPNEEANQRKIHMFNNGEIDIFNDCKINSVFYGEILSGPRMPALMYMTWYKDMPTRDEAWKAFSSHPNWIKMKDMELYKNTATNNSRLFLVPLPYSQI